MQKCFQVSVCKLEKFLKWNTVHLCIILMFFCLLRHEYTCSIVYLRMHIYVLYVYLKLHIHITLYTYACIFMTCPGLQKPHWLPLYWARRLGMALSLVESMPSMVVISHPSQENKGTRHYGKILKQDYVMGIWAFYMNDSVRYLPKYSDLE